MKRLPTLLVTLLLLSGPAQQLASAAGTRTSRRAVTALEKYLALPADTRLPLAEQEFAAAPLTADDANAVSRLLWEDHVAMIRVTRKAEMEARRIKVGDLEMPFYYKIFGDKPKQGRSLYFSLHGGGGAPKQVNDQQWENQKRLYQPAEGVYLVPRAPTNTWNLWHQGHIDAMFDRLIENLVVFEGVNPNRVYLMGYSAGGDGVYQLAPRMADRWAAASMMAGHPNDSSPLSLRNIGFSIQVGGQDAAYNRNKVGAQWGERLEQLQKDDPGGYRHMVKIYPDKGHWMDREDRIAVPWMAGFNRDPIATPIVWHQDDVTHDRFSWLAVAGESKKGRSEIRAGYEGQQVTLTKSTVPEVTIRLSDSMMNLDKPVRVTHGGETLFTGRVHRSIRTIALTLAERGDLVSIFSAELTVTLP
jgi:hypothetical protein